MKDILAVTGVPKSTYMYWRKRFGRKEADGELEREILAIRKEHRSFGYRRICLELQKKEIPVNWKRVQRIVQKLGLQVRSSTRKYSSYRGRSAG